MKMKVALALIVCIAVTYGDAVYEPITQFYHETIGIQEAARIEAAENSLITSEGRNFGISSPSLLGQLPYEAGILIHLHSGDNSVCGGSLVSNTRVLTAAHCWTDAREFTVVLGSNLLFFGGTRVTTSNVEVHTNYNPTNSNNNIAIIKFNPINLNNNIQPIPISSGTNNYVGVYAIASGYGQLIDSTGTNNNRRFNHVRIPVMSNDLCAKTYGPNVVIDSTLCISDVDGKSTCGGNSGGPLVTESNSPILIGIQSFGSASGCLRRVPAGYTRVTSYNAWINARL